MPRKPTSGKPTKSNVSQATRQKLSVAGRANTNRLRHGLRTGVLPKDAKFIEVRINMLRREIEAAVLEARSAITITDAAYIQSACRWERHGCLAQRWLVKSYDKLTNTERLNFSREIARASTERDKALRLLDISRSEAQSMIVKLYGKDTA